MIGGGLSRFPGCPQGFFGQLELANIVVFDYQADAAVDREACDSADKPAAFPRCIAGILHRVPFAASGENIADSGGEASPLNRTWADRSIAYCQIIGPYPEAIPALARA